MSAAVPAAPPDPLETTASLLARARQGDSHARERLMRRYLPLLRRWGSGRLPYAARDLLDTDDLVQITLVRALNHVEHFEPRHEGAFLAYLRRILLNLVRDQIRRAGSRPGRQALDENHAWEKPTPLDELLGKEALQEYDLALSKLRERYQVAVVLKVEFGMSYAEIAGSMDIASPNAARSLVVRAMARLTKEMNGGRG